MEKIRAEYEITVGDFRKATYYGMFLRFRRPLQIMFVVLAVGVLYALGGRLGLGPVNYLVLFLAAAYLIWGLLLFGKTEQDILKYLRSPDSFIGCRYIVTLESHRLRIQIPERKADVSRQINQLACVFELSHLFLIYVDTQQTYLLPHRALTEDQRLALRKNFRERLGDRFDSRFDRPGKGMRLFGNEGRVKASG